jgi:hypothetical protein
LTLTFSLKFIQGKKRGPYACAGGQTLFAI